MRRIVRKHRNFFSPAEVRERWRRRTTGAGGLIAGRSPFAGFGRRLADWLVFARAVAACEFWNQTAYLFAPSSFFKRRRRRRTCLLVPGYAVAACDGATDNGGEKLVRGGSSWLRSRACGRPEFRWIATCVTANRKREGNSPWMLDRWYAPRPESDWAIMIPCVCICR